MRLSLIFCDGGTHVFNQHCEKFDRCLCGELQYSGKIRGKRAQNLAYALYVWESFGKIRFAEWHRMRLCKTCGSRHLSEFPKAWVKCKRKLISHQAFNSKHFDGQEDSLDLNFVRADWAEHADALAVV